MLPIAIEKDVGCACILIPHKCLAKNMHSDCRWCASTAVNPRLLPCPQPKETTKFRIFPLRCMKEVD